MSRRRRLKLIKFVSFACDNLTNWSVSLEVGMKWDWDGTNWLGCSRSRGDSGGQRMRSACLASCNFNETDVTNGDGDECDKSRRHTDARTDRLASVWRPTKPQKPQHGHQIESDYESQSEEGAEAEAEAEAGQADAAMSDGYEETRNELKREYNYASSPRHKEHISYVNHVEYSQFITPSIYNSLLLLDTSTINSITSIKSS